MYYIYKPEKSVGRTTIFQRCKSRTLTNTKVFIPLIMLYNFTKKEFEFYFVFDFKQQMSSAADSVCFEKLRHLRDCVFFYFYLRPILLQRHRDWRYSASFRLHRRVRLQKIIKRQLCSERVVERFIF